MEEEGTRRGRRKLVAALVVNAVPVAGVLALDWSLLALLVVYWIDLGAELLFAALEGLFAERPPTYDDPPTEHLVVGAFIRKRGGIPLPFVSPSIRIANLPAVVATLVAFGIAWLVVGGIGVGGVGSVTGAEFGTGAAATAGLGIVAVIVGRAVEAGGYVLDAEYEEISPGAALRSGIVPIVGVGSAMFFGGMVVLAGAPSAFVLAAVVGTKTLFDLARVYHDRLVAFDERDKLNLGFAAEFGEWPTIDTPLDGDPETLRPHRAALVVDGAVRGLTSPVLVVVGVFAVLFGLLGVGTRNWAFLLFVTQVVAGILAVFAALGVFDRCVRYLFIEYRVAGDAVARDRLFGPQWDVRRYKLVNADVNRTLADRLFGTETVAVEVNGRTVRLPHLPDGTHASWDGGGR